MDAYDIGYIYSYVFSNCEYLSGPSRVKSDTPIIPMSTPIKCETHEYPHRGYDSMCDPPALLSYVFFTNVKQGLYVKNEFYKETERKTRAESCSIQAAYRINAPAKRLLAATT